MPETGQIAYNPDVLTAFDWLNRALQAQGLPAAAADFTARLVYAALVLVASWLANAIARRFLLGWVKLFIGKTETTWDDALVKRHVFDRLANLAPAVVLYSFLPLAASGFPGAREAIQRVILAYMVLIGTLVLDSLLTSVVDIYQTLPISRTRPIKTYVQVVSLVIYVISAILILATLLDRSPWGFLTGLGAMTAVIMLVFKDTILGFVASIQLIANDMVRRGDWIEVPKYGADGDVIDLSVNTVKVRNWDKTISTIPTYSLITDSFKNWRGMSESGGRRIKRALCIDMNSVQFCSETMLDRFEDIALLRPYLKQRRAEVVQFNTERKVASEGWADGRHLTNLGTFRAYVEAYLRQHPKIHPRMTFLIRQLPPGPTGLPIELYVFSSDQVWANYEAIQADIFDHLIAVLPQFGLRVFQSPSGADVQRVLRSTPLERT